MDVMGGKITVNLKKNCTKIEKEETHAHHKRARSALSKKGCLICKSDAPQFRSAWSDSTRVVKVNRHKMKCRKMRPYCIAFGIIRGFT